MKYLDANTAWAWSLERVFEDGGLVSPRGMKTRELQNDTITCALDRPVVVEPARKLSYRFMAAEAYWILSGDDTVAGIAPWNDRIKEFSDDGVTFFGAYGPKIKDQLPWAIATLERDRDTRQAGITIWREKPVPSKDIPCTVAIWFQIREGKLDVSVFMRSNDRWLGTPYDIFNFSMLGMLVCGQLNKYGVVVAPGALRLTAASGHLYEKDWESARRIIAENPWMRGPEHATPSVPCNLWDGSVDLMNYLKDLRDTKPGNTLRWWEVRDAAL